MKYLKNEFVTVALDDRHPRVVLYEDAATGTRISGDCENVQPRLYLYRKSDKATITSDDGDVAATYTLSAQATQATYRASVTCDGKAAVEFSVLLKLEGRDLLVRLQDVKETNGYCFFSIRINRLAGALSDEKDSLMVTCLMQGRVVDPSKCKPLQIDYSWVGFTARPCGAVYRPGFMVTVDITGYEDLLVHEVRQYTRISKPRTIASLGGEMMYRQRRVSDPDAPFTKIKIFPPDDRRSPEVAPEEPILCGQHKDICLHFVHAAKGKKLDWTDAAKYFQSLLPADAKCESRYENTFVYKICLAHRHMPYMTFEEALDIIRQVYKVTGGMRQVCYLAYFQHDGGETGYPDMSVIYPPIGDKDTLRRVIQEAKKYNCVLSFHENLDVFDAVGPCVDGRYVARETDGGLLGSFWNPTQLLQISMPSFREQIRKIIDYVISEYGIYETYHLDAYSGGPYCFDTNPEHPYSAKAFNEGKLEILKDFNARGIDVTSECLTHPYVGHIGHVWVLFNGGTVWEGERAVPFANYIYHGAISWNSGRATDEKALLDMLIAGGGAGIEWPIATFIQAEARLDIVPTPWPQILDTLYLAHPPYMMFRSRRWTGMTTEGSVRRVEYASTSLSAGGPGSFIEVDDAKPGYKVVVDGKTIAEDFVTVFPAPDGKSYLAYARTKTELDWPAPAGWMDGPVSVRNVTLSGPGLQLEGEIKNNRLKVKLAANQPVRITQK